MYGILNVLYIVQCTQPTSDIFFQLPANRKECSEKNNHQPIRETSAILIFQDLFKFMLRARPTLEKKTITGRLLDKETSDALQPDIHYHFHHEIYRNRKKYLWNLLMRLSIPICWWWLLNCSTWYLIDAIVCHIIYFEKVRAGIFKESMGARHRGGRGLSYRPARLHRLTKFIPWNRFRGSLHV